MHLENKSTKTRNILSLVKLGSIIIISIVLLNDSSFNSSYSADNTIAVNYIDTMMFLVKLFLALALAVIYYIWSYVLFEKIEPNYVHIIQIVESVIFLLIFMVFVWITGKNESPYKIIFLFIIIPVSIQFKFRYGMMTASISSFYLLTLDLVLGPKKIINSNLENDIIVCSIFIMISWLLSHYVKMEKQHSQMLEHKANTDVLTGLNNHRFFYDKLQSLYLNETKTTNLALIFFDIDYFKDYNDMFGHLKGDVVLKLIGSKLKEIFSGHDTTIARYGGDEFAIIIRDKTKEQVYDMGEKIRCTIETMYFEGQEHLVSKNLTVSIGIAISDESIDGYIDLIKHADDALYKAKFTKKNRIEMYSSVYDMIKTNTKEEHFDLIASIKTLISIINSKDKYTYGHVERVVYYAKILADKLELAENDKQTLIYGAYIHDIGKVNIPEYILNKKTPLTNDEWDFIKQHPNIGVEIIHNVESLSEVVPLVLHHHERFDGTGYPDQLKGEEIPYLARILTVADSFDAMTFNRPYKSAMTYDEVIMELKRCSNTQFDPYLTEVFIEIIKDMMKSKDAHTEFKVEFD